MAGYILSQSALQNWTQLLSSKDTEIVTEFPNRNILDLSTAHLDCQKTTGQPTTNVFTYHYLVQLEWDVLDTPKLMLTKEFPAVVFCKALHLHYRFM